MKHEIKRVLPPSLRWICRVGVLSFILLGTSCGGGSGGGGETMPFNWLFGRDDHGYRDPYDFSDSNRYRSDGTLKQTYNEARDERNERRLENPDTPDTEPPFPIPDHIKNRIPR